MHPHAKAKVKWDLMVAGLIVYSTLIVPFRIGFGETPGWFGTLVDTIVDIGFALDIALSFRTACFDEVIKCETRNTASSRKGSAAKG